MLWSLGQLSDSFTLGLNEVGSFKIAMIRDWRGRFMKYREFELFAVKPEEGLNEVKASLLPLVQENDDNKVRVRSTFFTIRSMKESFKAPRYTSEKGRLCNSICQFVVAAMKDRLSVLSSRRLELSAFETASPSEKLSKMCQCSCIQVMGFLKDGEGHILRITWLEVYSNNKNSRFPRKVLMNVIQRK